MKLLFSNRKPHFPSCHSLFGLWYLQSFSCSWNFFLQLWNNMCWVRPLLLFCPQQGYLQIRSCLSWARPDEFNHLRTLVSEKQKWDFFPRHSFRIHTVYFKTNNSLHYDFCIPMVPNRTKSIATSTLINIFWIFHKYLKVKV